MSASYGIVAGVDEVGRGCWAGPLVAGAVILRQPITGVRDSKKLTKVQRERLAARIQAEAVACGIGWVWPAELDELGMTKSVRLAFERALEPISDQYDELVIDGAFNFLPDNPKAKAEIKADDSVPAVSAASIIAKVARDRYMIEMASVYSGYGFERHVGYGTAAHTAALQELGICDLHRRSFAPVRARILSK